jgi:hypothetical protein
MEGRCRTEVNASSIPPAMPRMGGLAAGAPVHRRRAQAQLRLVAAVLQPRPPVRAQSIKSVGANRRNESIATIRGLAMMAPSPAHETFPLTAGAGHALDFFEFAVPYVESDREVLQWTL